MNHKNLQLWENAGFLYESGPEIPKGKKKKERKLKQLLNETEIYWSKCRDIDTISS